MAKPALLLLMAGACCEIHAQEAIAVHHYALKTFAKGKVYQKSGSVDEANLNYNVLSREIIFESAPDKYLALAEPEKVDSVVMEGHVFVPANEEFYERLVVGAHPLLLQYSCTVKEPGNDIGYGMTSVTTASPAVKSLIKRGGAYSLKLPDGFEVIPVYNYWTPVKGKYQKIGNAKQTASALPEKKDIISQWTNDHHTDFSKQEEVINLFRQLQ